jgi:5-methylcytosine-specific restriction enzyme subunit McrC
MMRAYSVREWRAVCRGDGEGCIPPHLAQRLVDLAKASPFAGSGGGGVLEDRRHDIRARGVVGILAVPDCTLEILPKIDVGEQQDSPEETREIRKRLVHMLAVALDLRIETGRMTDLDWQRETLLEILIRVFCDKLTEAVRRGMPRRYTLHEDDLPTLRGSLDIPRQFSRHIANPGRLACRYNELSEDIAINRIMKATIAHLSRMSGSATNVQRLRELAFIYAEVADVQVSALRWEDVVIDRTNSAWQELFGMAELFLRNRYQTTSGGAGQGTALLFEMDALFEEYMGRLVSRALFGSKFRVTLQGGRRFCLKSLDDEREIFQTKPDILIWCDEQIVHVIDTKWKRISAQMDDRKQGVSQADVYQMMAYAHLYKAPRLTLLYPHHAGLGEKEGIRARFQVTGQETVLETASFDISSRVFLVDRIMDRILANRDLMPDGAASYVVARRSG